MSATWQSMFTPAPFNQCTVKVVDHNSSPATTLFNYALSPNSQSSSFALLNGYAVYLVIDSNGVVSLETTAAITPDVGGIEIDVVPSYDVSAKQTQISGLSTPTTVNWSGSANNGGASPAPITIGAAGACTPASVAFPALANAVLSFEINPGV